MRPTRRPLWTAAVAALSSALLAPLAAQAAGQVQVKWIDPDKYADAGRGALDRERTLKALGEHLQSLGQRLPEGQTLSLEVTDVELAGEIDPFFRLHQDVRVLRGQTDWPRISLRYTLSEGTRTLASGAADLSDPNYLYRGLRVSQRGELAYEKRMLDDWVASLVASLVASGRR